MVKQSSNPVGQLHLADLVNAVPKIGRKKGSSGAQSLKGVFFPF
jgi:hypothetical protein